MAGDKNKDQGSLSVGQRVVVLGKRKGTVRFCGPTEFGPGEWVGIELDKPTGSHDGGAHGKRYFTCAQNHGVYVQRQGVLPVNSWQAAASQIQSMLRGRKDRQETEYKRAFHTWNQMEMEDESDYLNQTATISRVEAMLRTYHPGQAGGGSSAMSLSLSAGVSTNPAEWGQEFTVGSDYKGPHLRWPLTLENVQQVLHHIRTRPDEPIHDKYVAEILGKGVTLFNEMLPTSVCDMKVPATDDGKLVICGDTHGQLADFLWVLKQNGEPSPNTGYLLNGDIADRGENACEIIIIALMYKILYPDMVSINRGNHENIEMNRRSADHGGGFFDEVKSKHDPSLFMMFQQLFEVLPLATVLSDRVFVVHGGLFRRDAVQVQHLRNLNRRRQCPTSTESIEESLMFDCLWADPWDFPGVAKAAHRGQNCIRFGPDVTKRFLGNNSLSLCIRSHEVPNTLRGFEDRHDGRLITVFTASNYCGQTGNFGAVVIFHSDMSYTVEEHMAPPLENLIAEYWGQGPGETGSAPGPAASQPAKNAQSMEKSKEKMEEDMLAKLEAKVVQHKDDLYWYWAQVDPEGTGKVSSSLWRQGMAAALQLELPWFSLQKQLVETDPDGNVDYKKFLERAAPHVEQGKAFDAGWEHKVVLKVYEQMLRNDMALKDVIALFDQNGDGLVSPWEFKQALSAANTGVPDAQINAILRVIERDEQGRLDVRTFLDRFQVVYSQGKDATGSKGVADSTKKLLTKVGRLLVGSKSRVEVFQQIDTNGDGYVDQGEFFTALKKMKLDDVSEGDKAELWKAVDVNKDGHLNYLEFCAAFEVVDTSTTSNKAVAEIVAAILGALQKNQMTLGFAFRYFDPKGEGKVSIEDFKSGLKALNASIQGPGGAAGPLTEDQLEVVANHVDSDRDGMVDYQEFLSAFNPGNRPSDEFRTASSPGR